MKEQGCKSGGTQVKIYLIGSQWRDLRSAGMRSPTDYLCQTILNMLQPFYVSVWKVAQQGVSIVKMTANQSVH